MSEHTVVDNPEASRFEILVDGQVAGFAAYERQDDAVAFTHTEIDPAFEGQGLGSELARQALELTRARGLAVRPFCPFIRGYVEHHPEQLDLVPPAERQRFGLPAAR